MRKLLIALVVASAAVAAPAAFADHPGEGGAPLGATLTGEAECNAAGVCGLGDPTGSGSILLRLNPGQEEICFDMTATVADPIFASHIHEAPAGVAGPIVVTLTGAFGDAASDCVFAPRELIIEILQNPENYYVNVHTRTATGGGFPAGAVRGQLDHVPPGQA